MLQWANLFYFIKITPSIMRGFFIVILYFFLYSSKAQFYTLPNHYLFQNIQEYNVLNADTNIVTNVYPYNPFIADTYSNIDTSYHLFKYIKNDPALDILFQKDVLSIKRKEFFIRINPILNFQKGKQSADTNISAFTNTRGFIASAKLDNVYIETMLSENQSVFPEYLYSFSKTNQVVPGQGRWKVFKKSGFDYAFSASMIMVKASKNIYLSTGTGKQKIGNGYRSLILSDNAFVYPYFKIEQHWWKGKLLYVCNYALLNNLTPASLNHPPNTERLFQKKPFVYQYLNIGVFKHTRIGLYQGIIGESADTKNIWRGDGILFSPIIFSQALYYGMNRKNHILIGIDFQQKIFKTLVLYGQYILDDDKITFDDKNRFAYQVGFKWLKKFNDWRIMILNEWNNVNSTTYMSPIFDNFSNSSYSHFNQNLAFTPENGMEWISLITLKKQRWLLSGQYHYQEKKLTNDIINYYKILFGFVLNPSYNLMINFGYENRTQIKNNNYIYIQLQTCLYNIYYDF